MSKKHKVSQICTRLPFHPVAYFTGSKKSFCGSEKYFKMLTLKKKLKKKEKEKEKKKINQFV